MNISRNLEYVLRLMPFGGDGGDGNAARSRLTNQRAERTLGAQGQLRETHLLRARVTAGTCGNRSLAQ